MSLSLVVPPRSTLLSGRAQRYRWSTVCGDVGPSVPGGSTACSPITVISRLFRQDDGFPSQEAGGTVVALRSRSLAAAGEVAAKRPAAAIAGKRTRVVGVMGTPFRAWGNRSVRAGPQVHHLQDRRRGGA